MHKKNKHKDGYDLSQLKNVLPELEPFVFVNTFGKETIDFSKPEAVKALNTALLKAHYDISFWEFPNSYLCPAIPGRVDYIHYISDILKRSHIKENIKVLDIGTGANCIYPLLGNREYDWQFIGTDISEKALKTAKKIIVKNELAQVIGLRHQPDKASIFNNVIAETDKFSITMCNPPFYKSEAEALEATTKKLKGLGHATGEFIRNFSGQSQELWFQGGEKAFLHTYLYESSLHKTNCFWYTSLVSNKDNVKSMYKSLKKLNATGVKTIEMKLGNKISRVVAWTFLTPEEQKEWTLNEAI